MTHLLDILDSPEMSVSTLTSALKVNHKWHEKKSGKSSHHGTKGEVGKLHNHGKGHVIKGGGEFCHIMEIKRGNDECSGQLILR